MVCARHPPPCPRNKVPGACAPCHAPTAMWSRGVKSNWRSWPTMPTTLAALSGPMGVSGWVVLGRGSAAAIMSASRAAVSASRDATACLRLTPWAFFSSTLSNGLELMRFRAGGQGRDMQGGKNRGNKRCEKGGGVTRGAGVVVTPPSTKDLAQGLEQSQHTCARHRHVHSLRVRSWVDLDSHSLYMVTTFPTLSSAPLALPWAGWEGRGRGRGTRRFREG